MSEKKKKSGFAIIILIAVVLVAAAGVAAISANQKPLDAMVDVATAQPAESNSDTTASKPTGDQEAAAPAPDAIKTAESTETTSAPDDLTALTTPRILGNPDAPVKISEHSSFTCGACAAYHRTNFKTLKADYIDTGKAYIVFDDFPRTEVDIMVGSLARCLTGDTYFNFVQLLFETQSEWVNEGYKAHVKQNAMIAGLSDERAEECMNNKAVHEALAKSRQAAQDKFNINSTPHLVINDQKVIPGLSPYDELKKAIDEELAKKGK